MPAESNSFHRPESCMLWTVTEEFGMFLLAHHSKECKTFRAGNVSLALAMGEDPMIHTCKLYIQIIHPVQQMSGFC